METPGVASGRAGPRSLKIRAATHADLDELVTIYLDSARHHATVDPTTHVVPETQGATSRIRSKLADRGLATFVAETEDGVVGLLELQMMPAPPAGSIARTTPTARVGLAVRDGRRGEGVGTCLMAFAEQWARENGCMAIVLDMSAANEGALRFYERLGYAVYGLMLRRSLPSPRSVAGG
jgi:GNAT superfamily N-acetyltransferase